LNRNEKIIKNQVPRQWTKIKKKIKQHMEYDIKGKIALVTAASRGLGRGCAEALALEGCHVAICSRNASEAESAAQDIAARTGSQVLGLAADLRNQEQIDQLVQQVSSSLGDPDILITNAGGPPPGTFQTTALKNYQEAFNLTLMSAAHLIHQLYPAMKAKRWGRIIAITSISVKQPIADLLLSNMARAGLTGLLKTISTELAPYGITVNGLLPGIHDTSRVKQLIKDRAMRENKSEKEIYREMVSSIPCNTIGTTAEFGAAAAFLASRQARYITGQNLLIDGGQYRGVP
jgi:3-oxoacyl-[acyl-carrier protein] reductase